jgi:hypothetical protein
VKPTEQTKFSLFYSDGRRTTYGNCLIACISSILEISIHEVPNIYTFYGLDQKDTPTESQMWFKIMNIWLNYKFNKVLVKHEITQPTNHPYVIMRGLSMRKKPHTCIYENNNGQFVNFFDPHPTMEGLCEFHYYLTIENL